MNSKQSDTESTLSEEQLVESSKKLLHDNEATMDAATLSRLHHARSRALEQRRAGWLWWPAMGAVTAAAFTGFVFFPSLDSSLDSSAIAIQESAVQLAVSMTNEDLELLSSTEDLEFLAELEFYAWLEETELDDV